jgi:hypothetical protein
LFEALSTSPHVPACCKLEPRQVTEGHSGFANYGELLGALGKHKTGVSCLYIKTLDDVHMPTLKKIVRESVRQMKKSGFRVQVSGSR